MELKIYFTKKREETERKCANSTNGRTKLKKNKTKKKDFVFSQIFFLRIDNQLLI